MRFLADVMLGALARWLRTLGYDTLYFRKREDRDLARTAAREGRILLTRDRRLADFLDAVPHLFICSNDPGEQLQEVLAAFGLMPDPDKFFSRCIRCNSPLIDLERKEVEGKVPEYVFHNYSDFKSCTGCGRIYWPGSHKCRMMEHLKAILPQGGSDPSFSRGGA